MTEAYDPTKDPTADGYTFVGVAVDPAIDKTLAPSKGEWKATSQSALTGANAAPDATPAHSGNFWRWFTRCAAVVLLGVCWLMYSRHQAHKAEIAAIENPISEPAEINTSLKSTGMGYGKSNIQNKASKSATENIAAKTLSTPDSGGFYGLKPSSKKPSIDDRFTSQFDKDLSQFESTMKKELP